MSLFNQKEKILLVESYLKNLRNRTDAVYAEKKTIRITGYNYKCKIFDIKLSIIKSMIQLKTYRQIRVPFCKKC